MTDIIRLRIYQYRELRRVVKRRDIVNSREYTSIKFVGGIFIGSK